MKKQNLFLCTVAIVFWATTSVTAQVAISTDGSAPHTSAMLEVKSTNKGLLIPRLTTAQRTTLGGTATAGLMVYDTDLGKIYFHNGTSWYEGGVGNYWTKTSGDIYPTTLSDFVGIGTNNPVRPLEVTSSNWQVARLSTTLSGPCLEFVGTAATDWSLTSWANTFQMESSDDNFSSRTTRYLFGTTDFRPYYNNSNTLGTSSYRWNKLYATYGDFSGSVGIGTSSPARTLEVVGSSYRAARFSSSDLGATIELVGAATTDWSIGSWNNFLYIDFSDDNFATYDSRFIFTKTEFKPQDANIVSLGSSGLRWSNLYSVAGDYSGNVTITGDLNTGSIVPTAGKLVIRGGTNPTVYILSETLNNNATLFLGEQDENYGMYWYYDGYNDKIELYGKGSGTPYGPHMTVYRTSGNTIFSGNIAIGSTFASGYKLSVDGKIMCEEVRVALSGDWPDYVFGKEYNLLPVEKLGEFIDQNGHLPNIPAATEIEESGLELGEMQRLMMEKIEELSLYIVEQQKQNIEQQKQIGELKAQIEELKNK